MAKKKVTKKKNPVGRPTKYDPEFCNLAIEVMKKGFSKEAVAGHIGISKDTLYRWAEEHKNFSDALKEGLEYSRAFWEKAALDNLTHDARGKQLNSTVWIFNMKNRFSWTDRKEVTTNEEDRNITVNLAYDLKDKDEKENKE